MARPKERHYSRVWVFLLRPRNAEFDAMLRELGQVFPGRELASVLGISILTLDGWRKGKNGPCAAARKLVWLLWAAIFRPDCVQTAFDVITWGRFTVQERCRHQSPLTASAEDWSI